MAQRIVQLICPMLEAKIDLASSIEQSFVFLFFVSDPGFSVVELTGIEPVTSWLQTRRSPN
jgi:hypothetical protein